MHVKVTAAHIERGSACDSDLCPIALSLNESTGLRWSVDEVGATPSGFNADRYDLPKTARDFISAYDTGKDVEPFEFDLDLEEP